MFAGTAFTPTYSGPIRASGEIMRRSRNSAMAQSEFAGNQRAVRPMQMMGIGAGNGRDQYRTGLASDVERAKGFAAAQQSVADHENMLAQANLTYQTNDADEMAGIRNLLLGNRRTDQSSDLDLRGLDIGAKLSGKQRRVQNESARLQRSATVGGILAGLFRS